MTAILDAAALAERMIITGVLLSEAEVSALRLLASHARESSAPRAADDRADLLTRLAIASGHAPPCPDIQAHRVDLGHVPSRPATPDEWAAHLMVYAKALGRAVDHELAERDREEAARVEAAQHLHECTPASCAAGCPDVQRRRMSQTCVCRQGMVVWGCQVCKARTTGVVDTR